MFEVYADYTQFVRDNEADILDLTNLGETF